MQLESGSHNPIMPQNTQISSSTNDNIHAKRADNSATARTSQAAQNAMQSRDSTQKPLRFGSHRVSNARNIQKKSVGFKEKIETNEFKRSSPPSGKLDSDEESNPGEKLKTMRKTPERGNPTKFWVGEKRVLSEEEIGKKIKDNAESQQIANQEAMELHDELVKEDNFIASIIKNSIKNKATENNGSKELPPENKTGSEEPKSDYSVPSHIQEADATTQTPSTSQAELVETTNEYKWSEKGTISIERLNTEALKVLDSGKKGEFSISNDGVISIKGDLAKDLLEKMQLEEVKGELKFSPRDLDECSKECASNYGITDHELGGVWMREGPLTHYKGSSYSVRNQNHFDDLKFYPNRGKDSEGNPIRHEALQSLLTENQRDLKLSYKADGEYGDRKLEEARKLDSKFSFESTFESTLKKVTNFANTVFKAIASAFSGLKKSVDGLKESISTRLASHSNGAVVAEPRSQEASRVAETVQSSNISDIDSNPNVQRFKDLGSVYNPGTFITKNLNNVKQYLASDDFKLHQQTVQVYCPDGMTHKDAMRSVREKEPVNIMMSQPFNKRKFAELTEKIMGSGKGFKGSAYLSDEPLENQSAVGMYGVTRFWKSDNTPPLDVAIFHTFAPHLDHDTQPDFKIYMKNGTLVEDKYRSEMNLIAKSAFTAAVDHKTKGAKGAPIKRIVLPKIGQGAFLGKLNPTEKEKANNAFVEAFLKEIKSRGAELEGIEVVFLTDAPGESGVKDPIHTLLETKMQEHGLVDKIKINHERVPSAFQEGDFFVNAGDKHTFFGNGNEGDVSIDGFLGRDSGGLGVFSSLMNPNLSNPDIYKTV